MAEHKKTGQGRTLKKVFRYLGRYRVFVVFSILLAAVSVALTLYIPKLTGHAVDYIIGPGQVDIPGAVQVMIRIGVCTLITALAQWLMNVCNNKMTYQVVRDIRNEAFQKIEVLPLKYIDGNRNHCGNIWVHAVCQCEDHICRGTHHTGVLPCGEFYRQADIYHVPQTVGDPRRTDRHDR